MTARIANALPEALRLAQRCLGGGQVALMDSNAGTGIGQRCPLRRLVAQPFRYPFGNGKPVGSAWRIAFRGGQGDGGQLFDRGRCEQMQARQNGAGFGQRQRPDLGKQSISQGGRQRSDGHR